MSDEEQEYTFRQIEPGDNLAGLSLGSEAFVPLKTYFGRHAHEHHIRGFAKTYGAFAQNAPKKAVGCITLVCGEISVRDVGQADGLSRFQYDHCPAVKIARFAVDRKHRKKGVGKTLVDLALGIVNEFVSPKVGCRFVVVDSKQESVSYYRDRCGFTFLDTEDNRKRKAPIMFLDVLKAGGAASQYYQSSK